MNRKNVMAIGLAVSVFFNIVLFLFAFVQKSAADVAREQAVFNEKRYLEVSRVAKAQLDICEGLRAKAEEAHEDCERKILALSNKK
jgi:hypothetical protein